MDHPPKRAIPLWCTTTKGYVTRHGAVGTVPPCLAKILLAQSTTCFLAAAAAADIAERALARWPSHIYIYICIAPGTSTDDITNPHVNPVPALAGGRVPEHVRHRLAPRVPGMPWTCAYRARRYDIESRRRGRAAPRPGQRLQAGLRVGRGNQRHSLSVQKGAATGQALGPVWQARLDDCRDVPCFGACLGVPLLPGKGCGSSRPWLNGRCVQGRSSLCRSEPSRGEEQPKHDTGTTDGREGQAAREILACGGAGDWILGRSLSQARAGRAVGHWSQPDHGSRRGQEAGDHADISPRTLMSDVRYACVESRLTHKAKGR